MTEHLNGIIDQLEQQKMAIEQALVALRGVETVRAPATQAADQYFTRPFHAAEATARIRTMQRRSSGSLAHNDEFISIGDLELHPARWLVTKAGAPVHLTPKEFDLLHYLMSHAGLAISHSQLLHVVWGPEYANQVEYLRTFMRQLRKKLEDDAGNPKYLLTDSRVGYRFIDPARVGANAKRGLVGRETGRSTVRQNEGAGENAYSTTKS